jgi:hypothetical protein
MRSKDSGKSQASVPGDVAPLNPRSPIEVASSGGGGVDDPSGKDRRPPGAAPILTAPQKQKGEIPSGGSVRAKRAKTKEKGHKKAQSSPRHSP